MDLPVCYVCRTPDALLVRALLDGNVNATICPRCLGEKGEQAASNAMLDRLHAPKPKPKARRKKAR